MKLTVKDQRGIGALGGVAVIIVLLAMAGIGWFVYHSQQSTNKTLNETTSASENSTPPTTPSKTPEQTTFSKLPKTLQTAIVAQTKADAPSCVKNDKLVDVDGKATDPDATYQASGFAVTRVGCDSGSNGLFVQNGTEWKFVAATQMDYKCADLKANKVPLAFLQALPANKDAKQINCVPDDPNATAPETYKG